ncbi:MAG: MBL fold metallo-hydrolase [Treponema sp.]|nr:MBL fold metallo-hydrolase [Treponema sp.]
MTVTKEPEGFFILDDGRVRCFLFVGENDALLIDTAFPDSNIIDEVKKITSLPVKVALTHGDMDHTGGLKDFGKCYVHGEDFKMIPDSIEKHELKEGDILTAGNCSLKVIHIPGHTYGSIAFLEEEKSFILTGDGVQKNGMIFMFGENRNFPLYLESLKKLRDLVKSRNIKKIYPSHSECPLPPEAAKKVLEDAENIYAGKIPMLKKHEFFPCNIYQCAFTGFLYSN